VAAIPVDYFSDVLCIWAYVAQARVEALKSTFGESVHLNFRFCSVFGDTAGKIPTVWRDRGGYAGFNAHLLDVARKFSHVEVNPQLWLDVRPASSASAHLFLAAVRLSQQAAPDPGDAPSPFERLLWALRVAFFRDGADIARLDVQRRLAEPLGFDCDAVEGFLRDGTAHAKLAADYQDADRLRIEGSPSFVLNEGRQKLYGNVGFRILEANIQELLRAPSAGEASWC
jgi:predicted DsbA family dithiol-disulfide isomerase